MFRAITRLCCFRTITTQHNNNVKIDSMEQHYTNLIRQCTQINKAKILHATLLKSHHIPFTLFLQNHLLTAYFKLARSDSALHLFDQMPDRNVVSWTALIAGLVRNGVAQLGLMMFRGMIREGVGVNEFTLVSVLQGCSLLGCVGMGYQVYGVVVRLGFEGNVYLVNAFLTTLVRCGRIGEALGVFEGCLVRDVVSWNTMMGGFLQWGYSEVPGFWRRMVGEGVLPDEFSFASVFTGLGAVCDVRMGVQVHGWLVKSGFGCEICVGNSLVDMYLKNEKLKDGFKAFEEMDSKDVCSWTEMAAGCLHYGEPNKALEVVAEMRMAGVRPNKFTLATALNACANLAALEEGKRFHSLRLKLGDDIDVCVNNALLDMYVKCGCIDGAWGVFKSMKERSIVSWTTMIMGCAHNGLAREALEIYEEMRMEGVEPNYITFICVLYACSQGGFVDEGWKYFTSMTEDYNLSPGEDHYVCMVNLLGRAGLIKEAEELILKMPIQPSILVWQTLLGSCQMHGDVETGKRAAQHALNLDKKDPSTYILLSNMFAGLRNWDDVGMLRRLMSNRDVKKVPGSSWIETDKSDLQPPASRGFM